jgi:hypothetical protein
VSYQVWQIRRWLDRHPNIVEPRDVAHRMTIEHQLRRSDISGTGPTMAGPKLPDAPAKAVVSERLVRQAQLIPTMVPLDTVVQHSVA